MAIPGGPQGEVLLNFLLQDSLRYSVSLDKDRYLTPAPNLRRTSASHDSQYTIYMAYSDALKNSFFPRTIPYSLPSSVVSSKTAEEIKALVPRYHKKVTYMRIGQVQVKALIWIRGSEVYALACLCPQV